MIMKYSLLDSSGICINHILLDEGSDWQPPEGSILAKQELNIGDTYSFDSDLNEWVLVHVQRLPYDEQAQLVRSDRNCRLAESDWTQFTDSPLDPEAKAAWAFYRENLRMVPDQPGFPWDVQWPPKPNA